jgi:hypothetical protein
LRGPGLQIGACAVTREVFAAHVVHTRYAGLEKNVSGGLSEITYAMRLITSSPQAAAQGNDEEQGVHRGRLNMFAQINAAPMQTGSLNASQNRLAIIVILF